MGKTEKSVVLLAEDEPTVRTFTKTVLLFHGYQVLEASDGQEALDLSFTYIGHIHLLLTDLRMPRVDGATLATRLLAHRPELKVLVMSAYTENAVVVGDAVMPFLRKPFVSRDLIAKIREVLPAVRE